MLRFAAVITLITLITLINVRPGFVTLITLLFAAIYNQKGSKKAQRGGDNIAQYESIL